MKYICLLIAFLITLSCSNDNRPLQDTILLSDNFKAIIHKRDTIFNLNVESPKIVAYYNSNGCTLCRL